METILEDTRIKLKKIEKEKIEVIKRIRKLLIADNMKPLDFKKKDKKGFVEYYPGVWVRDISSELMHVLGITSLHLMVKYDTEIPAHEHNNQSQTVFVKTGKIYDLGATELHKKGESFIVKKQHNHKLKYFSGSEYLITFHPNLVEA